ncbi:type IV toxin-antitoxin system AbiEi family antitoxin domain-containing protein [Ornithinimicrobium faecis]|uniref:type IV toxin-antitoxin system AbiEi family antitoxin domain-containing protein n=1 Tax=Ornithinimicrobium faecis TaxID=2934158 RepID=UPI003CE551A6
MSWKRVASRQHGVISVQQALEAGLTPGTVRARSKGGQWQRLHRGVYLTHSGPVSDEAVAHGVLLAAGPDAVLGHDSVLWAWGLQSVPSRWTVFVPHDRRRRVDGAVLVRLRDMPRARHVNGYHVTSVQRAIVDLADLPGAVVDDIIAVTAKACQKGFTAPERISMELASRRAHRMRRPLRLILGDVEEGVESLAEHRFLHRVVREPGCRASSCRLSRVGAERTSSTKSLRSLPRSTGWRFMLAGSDRIGGATEKPAHAVSSRSARRGGMSTTSRAMLPRISPRRWLSVAGQASRPPAHRPAVCSACPGTRADGDTSRPRVWWGVWVLLWCAGLTHEW